MKFGAVTKVSTFLIITQVSSGLEQIVYSQKSCVIIGVKANVLALYSLHGLRLRLSALIED